MSATAIPQLKICDQNLIGAYVDGELDADLTLRLEEHLTDCADCQFELRAHRLFVCELDSALSTRSRDIPVPADFSRRVAARATSDMSGVRTCSENRKALAICLVLALAGFALVGTAARDIFFLVSERLVSKIFAVLGLLASTLYDAVTGLVVVIRFLGRRVIVETGSLWPMLGLLAFGVLVLSRLISNYHRSGATE
jgi:anti-sigma factor RsiW